MEYAKAAASRTAAQSAHEKAVEVAERRIEDLVRRRRLFDLRVGDDVAMTIYGLLTRLDDLGEKRHQKVAALRDALSNLFKAGRIEWRESAGISDLGLTQRRLDELEAARVPTQRRRERPGRLVRRGPTRK